MRRGLSALCAVGMSEQWAAAVTTIVPLGGLIFAIGRGYQVGHVTAVEIGLFATMYVATCLGLTLGFHRYFSHRGFKCTPRVQWTLGMLGSMAAQGPLFYWVRHHRQHHQKSDAEGDPHSPHCHGQGALGVMRGWCHAQMGWMFARSRPPSLRPVIDLARDPCACEVNRLYRVAVAAGIILPGVVGAIVSQSIEGFLSGVIWGGLVRMFFVHHLTWSINSICHLFGSRPFQTGDESRNHALLAAFTFGEGWHNNHHAFPASARHGLRWWEIDLTYAVLRLMSRFGMAWDIRLPRAQDVVAKRCVVAAAGAGGVR